ncbi:unnamed protein product [Heterobilharzia americana]|nr:unnamed protein product [Heterobilharzia americana]
MLHNSEDKPTVNEYIPELRDKSASQNLRQPNIVQSAYEMIPDDGDKLSQQLRNDEIEIISPETHPEYFVPVAPDGGWSWVVLFATFCNYFIIDGIFFSIGLLMVEWTDHFGASKTKVSLISSLMLGCYQIIGPISAAVTNKFGCRPVALFGCCLGSISIFISSLMPSVEALIITLGIFTGISFGLIYLPALIAVSFYFNKKREIASGIAVTGTPLGAVVFGPLSGFLIRRYGWSNTLILFSAFMLHGVCLSCLYRPLKPKSKLEALDLLKETDETAIGLVEEIQSNLFLSNAFIRSNQFFNSTGRMGQTLYEVDEVNEDEQKSFNKESTKSTSKQFENEKAEKKQFDKKESEYGIEKKEMPKLSDQEKMLNEVDRKLIDSGSLAHSTQVTLSNLPVTKETTEISSESIDQYTSVKDDKLKNSLHENYQQTDDKSSEHEDKTFRREDIEKDSRSDERQNEEQSNQPDRNRNLLDDQSVIHSLSKMSPKLISFSHSRSGRTDPTSYIFSTPCLSVNPGYDEHTGNASAKFLQDVNHRRARQPLRNQFLPNQRIQRPTTSRQRHLSHNLTPNIPTIEEDEILTKSCAHDQLLGLTGRREFTSAITVPNLFRDRRGIPPDTNPISSGLIRGSVMSGLTSYPQKLEIYKIDSKPVLVALPHQSITVEDYSRPLYRSDIFFSGNPIPNLSTEQYLSNIGLSSTNIVNKANQQNLNDRDISNSHLTIHLNDTNGYNDGRGLTDCEHESAFYQSQSNWMESLIVSLTSIPLPNDGDNRGILTKQNLDEKSHKSLSDYGGSRLQNLAPDEVDDLNDDDGVIHDISLCDICLTGIRRLRDGRLCSSFSCLKRLYDCLTCFPNDKQIYKPVNKEHFNHSKFDTVDELSPNDYEESPKYTRCTRRVQCNFISIKPIVDVLSTMLDLSLLRKPKYLILWISNLTAVLGMYVPLIYVSDFASVYGISNKLSSYLLSIMGGSSIASRLLIAWISGLPHVSPLIVQTISQFLLGILVCSMPVLTTFSGMAIAFALYGFLSGIFSTLSTIILYDLVGMNELTTAVGLITLSRGISSVFGPPLAGVLFEATKSFKIPYFVAGMSIVISALLFLLIVCYNGIAHFFTLLLLKYSSSKKSKFPADQDEDRQIKQKLSQIDTDEL